MEQIDYQNSKVWNKTLGLLALVDDFVDNIDDAEKYEWLLDNLHDISQSMHHMVADGICVSTIHEYNYLYNLSREYIQSLRTQMVVAKRCGCIDQEKYNDLAFSIQDVESALRQLHMYVPDYPEQRSSATILEFKRK